MIVQGARSAGPDTMKAVQVMIAESINQDVEPARRQRAVSILLEVFSLAERIGQGQEQATAERERREGDREKVDVNKAFLDRLRDLGMDIGGTK